MKLKPERYTFGANWRFGNKNLSLAQLAAARIAANPALTARQARSLDFAHHDAPGVQVLFENYSIAKRIIHSGGPIPHGSQAAGDELVAGNGVDVIGGTYMPNPIVGNANTPTTAAVYLHNDEAGQSARDLRFNAPAPQ